MVNSITTRSSGLKMYPNPAKDFITISGIATGQGQADLYTLHGQKVMSSVIRAGEPLDVRSLNRGVYLVRLQIEGQVVNTKLVIE